MCWEQSRRKRTIATSRSDDNRDEARNRDNEKAGLRTANEPEELATSPGAPVTEQPGGKPFPLDKLFQERTDTPRCRPTVDPYRGGVLLLTTMRDCRMAWRRLPDARHLTTLAVMTP